MRGVTILLFLLFSTVSYGQYLLKPDTLEIVPESISKGVFGEVSNLLSIDLDGNGLNDFIAIVDTDDPFKQVQYWFSSGYELWLKKEWYTMGIQHTWFVNLDQDSELELFYATGYEDGIDYYFVDLDLKKGKEEIVFFFNPIILENNEMHWGYPWDISDILIKEDSITLIYVSLDHDIDSSMGELTRPENQPLFPIIFFTGHSTQPYDRSETIRNSEWKTIEDVIKAGYKNP